MSRGKRYVESEKLVDKNKVYAAKEALEAREEQLHPYNIFSDEMLYLLCIFF